MIPDYLPKGVGRELPFAPFPHQNLPRLKSLIRPKTIIAIDGLVGVGKSALGQNLSKSLGIPHLNSGFIYRILTHVYEDLGLAISPENTAKVLQSFSARLEQGAISLSYKGEAIEYAQLRNTHIDSVINKYNKVLDIRSQIDDYYVDFLTREVGPKTAFILDLHGAYPKYLTVPEEQGYTVIRILLIAAPEEKIRRRYLEYLQVNYSGVELGEREKQDLYEKCGQMVQERDSNDLASIQATGIGLVHPKTGIIDTTELSVEEVLSTTLSFIQEELACQV